MSASRPRGRSDADETAGALRPLPWLLGLSVALVVVWFPLTTYFFAQDDFGLIEIGARQGLSVVDRSFGTESAHFRPLTKGLYFSAMYRLFGIDATPYHAVSLLLHVANTWLVFGVLRRLRFGTTGALVGAALFGLNTAFFTSIAWVCAVQEVGAATFLLVSAWLFLDALEKRARGEALPAGALALSCASYACALASMEQPMGLPLFLGLAAWLHPRTPGFLGSARLLLGHGVLMVAYVLFMLFGKGVPEGGAYAYRIGHNTLVNLSVYTGWSSQFATLLPTAHPRDHVAFYGAQLLTLALLVAPLVLRRWRVLALALGAFLAFYGPVLGLTAHAYYHHTYVPALWILMPAALVADRLTARLPARRGRPTLALALGALAIASFVMVRRNERSTLEGRPRNFIIRQATVAQRMYDDVVALRGPGVPPAVQLLYERPEGRTTERVLAAGVINAIGNGALLRLIYGDLHLEVITGAAGDPLRPGAELFYYDADGACRREP